MSLGATDIAMLSMVLDFGWKVWSEKTKNMTPAELSDFIANREQSVAETTAEIEAKYGNI
jgi:hypothetical protein